MQKEEKKENRTDTGICTDRPRGARRRLKLLIPFFAGLFFAMALVFGWNLEKTGSVPFRSGRMWAGILILFGITELFLTFLYERWSSIACKQRAITAFPKEDSLKKWDRRTVLKTALSLFCCYLVVFLAVYPGFFVYDAQDELIQVVTRSFSAHHPLLHVLLMGGIIQLVHKLTGSYNSAIAAYILIQTAILSLVFSYGIGQLRKEGLSGKGRIAITIYFGVFPTIVMFVLCSAKDGLFMGAVFLMVLFLRRLFGDPEGFLPQKKAVLCLIASGGLMLLLRHNGVYAFLVFALIGVWFLWKKQTYRIALKFCLMAGAMLIGYLIVSRGLLFATHAQSGEHQEMLTVPIQQLARVYAYENDELSVQEKETLYEILPEQALRRYTPKLSDTVKIDFNNQAYEANPGKYQRLWLQIGRKHPFAYLNAWFMTSYGFWYPGAVIDAYRGNTVFTFTYEDSSYFGYETEEPGERHSLIPVLDKVYRWLSLDPAIQRIPIIHLLFSPACLFWGYLLLLGALCYGGEWKKAFPYLLPLLLWLTVILGPASLPRYVIYLWILLPVLLWDTVLYYIGLNTHSDQGDHYE